MFQKIFLAFLPFILVANVARIKNSQIDPKAKTILDESATNFKSYKSVNSKFTFTTENPDNTSSKTKGEIFLKGVKYKLIFDDQEIICDNKVVWTYLKDMNEVQITDYEPQKDEITPNSIFTIYKSDFAYLYTGDAKIGEVNCHLVELTPIDKTKPFFKVKLWMDTSNKMIKRLKIFDKNGSKYTYDITTLNTKIVLDDSFFVFDKSKHPGVTVEDLRL
jgi:outer membrane lipoprotein-sorting protein